MGEYNSGKKGSRGGTVGWKASGGGSKEGKFSADLEKPKKEKNDCAPENSKLEK